MNAVRSFTENFAETEHMTKHTNTVTDLNSHRVNENGIHSIRQMQNAKEKEETHERERERENECPLFGNDEVQFKDNRFIEKWLYGSRSIAPFLHLTHSSIVLFNKKNGCFGTRTTAAATSKRSTRQTFCGCVSVRAYVRSSCLESLLLTFCD